MNKIDLTNSKIGLNFNLPVPKKRKKYIFGDFVSLVEKYNMLHRFVLLKKAIQATTMKFDIEIRRKYKSLRKNNIQNFNFDRYIRDIFFSVNFNFNYYERNYQGKLNINKFVETTKKYISLIILKRINLFIEDKKNKAIKIQSVIRSYTTQKKFNIWKKELIIRVVIIQKYVRRYLVRKRHKNNLVSIIDFIQYNKRMKEYNKNLKIIQKKKKDK